MPVASTRAEYLSNAASPAEVAEQGRSRGEPALLDRLEAMKVHLLRARPHSGNDALRILRAAFPDAPLAERVRVIDGLPR
ncbi:hypothetical protein [Methylobrevis albus]|uniref:Uncharacterized protein n=1 Tax=Methylobrevis albus TaxID=2793297 RepID=A0A931N023_9HYPH|nr:hypothetical protein [Methylobrevis albus]MBH0239620.1 hypothetical protein [Methylobrevis albus]